MAIDHRNALAEIKRFDQLVAYLRDEMGWPVHSDSFEDLDDLFFDFTPEELGIDRATAAKIEQIKRLRPLVAHQPWGVFFIKFEPKRLPVVALRRILSQLAMKKRASANPEERAAWAVDDLLFVSNYGEGDDRQISLAHFSTPLSAHELPTLKVLGWDNRDTPLHLDAAAMQLREKLRWPADDRDVDGWREQWRSAFVLRHGEVIATSRDLATRLAGLARAIRDRISTTLAVETEAGPFRQLLAAFRELLVHELDEEGFADMYAQTIAYGLLSARIVEPNQPTATDLGNHLRTSPFLLELMQTFISRDAEGSSAASLNFDELGVNDVVALLDRANMEAVLRDFGDRNPREDPVIHFYELFLSEYDPKQRMQRGVFYTPRPVVSFIVRSVDELLREEFGLEDGLADVATWGELSARGVDASLPAGVSPDEPFVRILDPAVGTGTFLVEVIDVIHRRMVAKWKDEQCDHEEQLRRWSAYVEQHLLPRVCGYELLMAPYAICHLKISLKLFETGYRFSDKARARIYLSNALEPPHDFSDRLEATLPALAHEAQAVNRVKARTPFTVIIGNPPYANYSSNLGRDARSLVDPYRVFDGVPIRERNQLQFERNLQDDFVKFIAIGQRALAMSGVGVMGYITNATMLASTSLRGLRQRLVGDFSVIREMHLHGGVNEIGEGAAGDENVFDISQAVAIHLYARSGSTPAEQISYGELWGRRAHKYDVLLGSAQGVVDWLPVRPDSENCSFVPRETADDLASMRLDQVFVRFGAGIKTNRDAIAVAFDKGELFESVFAFDPKLGASDDRAKRLLYRPFDWRWVYYDERVVASRSFPTMQHMLAGRNIGLVASSTWTSPDRFSVNVADTLVEMKTGTHDRGTTLFPLFRYERIMSREAQRCSNVTREFAVAMERHCGVRLADDEEGPQDAIAPEDAFLWIYALCHSPTYRRRYRAALAQGFPIVFFPRSEELLRGLTRLGTLLSDAHRLDLSQAGAALPAYFGSDSPVVQRVTWSDGTVWLDAPPPRRRTALAKGSSGFRGVPEDAWNLYVGGYPVCHKWLKDRKGRTLNADDRAQYSRIVAALVETVRLMADVDALIAAHGGWPAAFAVRD